MLATRLHLWSHTEKKEEGKLLKETKGAFYLRNDSSLDVILDLNEMANSPPRTGMLNYLDTTIQNHVEESQSNKHGSKHVCMDQIMRIRWYLAGQWP